MFATDCSNIVPMVICIFVAVLCCVNFVPQNMFATDCPNFVPTVVCDFCCRDVLFEFCPKTCLQATVPIVSQYLWVICVAVICCVSFVPKRVCNQQSQMCLNCSVWFLLLCFAVWTLSQNMFATNCLNYVPVVVCDFCCCAVLCDLCPKTCLQPTVKMLAQLLCVMSVAVMCYLNFVPTHVCSQLSQCCPTCSVWFVLLWFVV